MRALFVAASFDFISCRRVWCACLCVGGVRGRSHSVGGGGISNSGSLFVGGTNTGGGLSVMSVSITVSVSMSVLRSMSFDVVFMGCC